MIDEPKRDDQLLASVVRFLIDGGEEDAASIILSCTLSQWESGDSWWAGDEQTFAIHVNLVGPRQAYEVLHDEKHPVSKAVKSAIQALLSPGEYLKHLTVSVERIEIDADWRAELLEIARGKGVHNQAADLSHGRLWNGLRFRSESETRIARELDRAGVLFLPNCKARVNSSDGRKNREPDFLVCASGKWGILEVDGEPFHPPSRTVEDHERDRLFRAHGIKVVEHFDAGECYNEPKNVVARFLAILAQD